MNKLYKEECCRISMSRSASLIKTYPHRDSLPKVVENTRLKIKRDFQTKADKLLNELNMAIIS